MTSEIQTVTLAGKSFVIVERSEFERLQALVRTVEDGDLPKLPEPDSVAKAELVPVSCPAGGPRKCRRLHWCMSDLDPSDSSERPGQPGTTRTWWHPLLARLLDHVLATAYRVLEEVLVGKLPLRLDILLIRREAGELSEASHQDLAVLLPLLNRFTLMQFKGPTDALQRGDLAQLVGCAFLWHSQQAEPIPQRDISLIVLAPTVNAAVRDELELRGQLTRTGHVALLYYMLQQVQQFRSLGEDFAMQHKDSEYLGEVEEELQTARAGGDSQSRSAAQD